MYPASMKVIGDMSTDGKSVELLATATDIMWRNVGDPTWQQLCPKSDLTGNTILSGSTDPLAANGKTGDYFINTTSVTLFGPKTAIGWPSGTVLKGTNGTNGTNATTTSPATQSANGLMSSADKTKLDGIVAPTSTAVASGGRPIGSAFTVHATRNAWVTYSLGYALTATLALGQNVQVTATVDGAEVARISDGILLGLAGSLNRNESISFFVPAGKQVLFTKTGTAAITVTVTSGQETLM